MKRIVHLTLTCLVVIGLAWTLWVGVRKQKEKPAEEEATGEGTAGHGEAKEEEKPKDFVVKLEKERWELLGLEKAKPEKAELKPQRIAFGRVLDPTPVVTLDGDLAAAEAALAASRAEYDRTQKLLAAGENMSRKVAETAEAQFRADEIKVAGLRHRAALEWGPAFAALDAVKRREFVDTLVTGQTALVRVDILPGDALAEQPKNARLLVLGREEQPVNTQEITPATDTDPRTQAQGFLLRVDKPPFAFRPGMALTAWLELPQEPRTGFAVLRSAVLRHDGRTWVYVHEEEDKFVRKSVILDTPLAGDKWFVAEQGGGIKADDLLIITGAQSLLSEELKAQGGAEPD
jgi:hypothetical protein